MAVADELKDALQKWIKVLEDPQVAAEFEGFQKTMQFVFPDVDVKLQLIFEGSKARVVEGFQSNTDMGLTVSSDIFLAIERGEIDPTDAFMEGQLKPTGDMADLEKLQVLMED